MVLGQELLRSNRYKEWYCAAHERGDFIIVDNGAAERDTPPFTKIVDAANAIGADEIIMPDRLGDREATAELLKQHASQVQPTRRMVVPQGRSVDEWFQSLEELTAIARFTTIGVPKHLEQVPGGRHAVLGRLVLLGYSNMYQIHLLGIGGIPKQEVEAYSGYTFVRGWDTGAPIAYAQECCRITAPVRHSLDWDKEVTDWDLLDRNIQWMNSKLCWGGL